jgi:hypothetical protein
VDFDHFGEFCGTFSAALLKMMAVQRLSEGGYGFDTGPGFGDKIGRPQAVVSARIAAMTYIRKA